MFKEKHDKTENHNPIDQYLIQERMTEQLRSKIAALVKISEGTQSEEDKSDNETKIM